MAAKVALITGVTGQDGAYLAELLLDKGYVVHGIKRRSSSFNTARIDHLYVRPARAADTRFFLHFGDMTDATNLIRLVQETQPDEIYNLAAQSHVQVSFETPEYTANADALGTLAPARSDPHPAARGKGALLSGLDLRALRQRARRRRTRRRRSTPRSPYARRQALCLLDHRELPRGLRHPCLQRHPVQSRKPDPRRNLRHPQDHARGRGHRARHGRSKLYHRQSRCPARLGPCARLCRGHVADAAAGQARRLCAGDRRGPHACANSSSRLSRWSAASSTGRARAPTRPASTPRPAATLVRIDPRYFRPTEVDNLVGDAAKARAILGWQHRVGFDELVTEMVMSDLAAARAGAR